MRWDLLDAFRTAAEQAGIKSITDFNCGDNEGCCAFHVNQTRGRRVSTARAFLKPVLHRPNLRLETGCLVEGIIFDGKRAVGVRWKQNGQARSARCRGEVVLAAGSLGSTQILLLSGVGPAAHLQEHGVAVVLDRPGVGSNLQDHLQLRMIYKVDGIDTLNARYHAPLGMARMLAEYALFRRGPLTMAPSQLGLFTRSDKDQERANLQYHVQPLSLDKFGDPLHKFPAFTASVCNVRPTSRGTVRLRSANPTDAPAIRPNYLSTDDDRRIAARAIRLTRRIAAQPALQPFHPDEYLPGRSARDDDEQALIKAAGDIGTTIFHPVGTAKMGLAERPDDGGRRAAARDRARSVAGDRRIGDAEHHVGQYQCADHDDRGKRRRHAARRCQSARIRHPHHERHACARKLLLTDPLPNGTASRESPKIRPLFSRVMWRCSPSFRACSASSAPV